MGPSVGSVVFDREELGSDVAYELISALNEEHAAGELKRMFVVLETGTLQHAAIALYERSGFRRIPQYGEYASSPETSLCMSKELR